MRTLLHPCARPLAAALALAFLPTPNVAAQTIYVGGMDTLFMQGDPVNGNFQVLGLCGGAIQTMTESYEDLLRRLDLEDRHVAASYPRSLVVRFLVRQLWAITLWRPVALVGLVFNWLPFKIPGWVTRSVGLKLDVRATWKVLIAMGLFPLFWLLAAALVGWFVGLAWGFATLVVAPLSGWVALTFAESWAALRGESAAFITLKGRRAAAAELVRRRRRVREEVTRLVRLHAERFGPASG